MMFKNDRQRRAVFANMSRFSKGRVPIIGETVYVHGDESVGIFPVNGKVVGVHKDSVDVEFKSGSGVVVRELGLEEFNDEVDMKAKQEAETSLYIDWLNEQSTKKLKEMAADVSMSGGEDKVLRSVLANRLMNGGRNIKFSQVTQEQIDSYMRRHGLKSVPDPQLVAEEDEADRFRMIGGKTVYMTPPDTAEEFREYEIGQMRKLDKEKRFADAPEALQTQHGNLLVKPEFLDAVSQPIKMVSKKDYTAKILGLDRQEPRGVSLGDYATEMSAQPVQREAIPGGYGSGMPDEMFDQEQLAKGIEVEKEHVIKFTDKGNIKKFKQSDLEKAKEISKDHLSEIPDYYDRLEKLEEQAKADGDFIDVVALRKEMSSQIKDWSQHRLL